MESRDATAVNVQHLLQTWVHGTQHCDEPQPVKTMKRPGDLLALQFQRFSTEPLDDATADSDDDSSRPQFGFFPFAPTLALCNEYFSDVAVVCCDGLLKWLQDTGHLILPSPYRSDAQDVQLSDDESESNGCVSVDSRSNFSEEDSTSSESEPETQTDFGVDEPTPKLLPTNAGPRACQWSVRCLASFQNRHRPSNLTMAFRATANISHAVQSPEQKLHLSDSDFSSSSCSSSSSPENVTTESENVVLVVTFQLCEVGVYLREAQRLAMSPLPSLQCARLDFSTFAMSQSFCLQLDLANNVIVQWDTASGRVTRTLPLAWKVASTSFYLGDALYPQADFSLLATITVAPQEDVFFLCMKQQQEPHNVKLVRVELAAYAASVPHQSTGDRSDSQFAHPRTAQARVRDRGDSHFCPWSRAWRMPTVRDDAASLRISTVRDGGTHNGGVPEPPGKSASSRCKSANCAHCCCTEIEVVVAAATCAHAVFFPGSAESHHSVQIVSTLGSFCVNALETTSHDREQPQLHHPTSNAARSVVVFSGNIIENEDRTLALPLAVCYSNKPPQVQIDHGLFLSPISIMLVRANPVSYESFTNGMFAWPGPLKELTKLGHVNFSQHLLNVQHGGRAMDTSFGLLPLLQLEVALESKLAANIENAILQLQHRELRYAASLRVCSFLEEWWSNFPDSTELEKCIFVLENFLLRLLFDELKSIPPGDTNVVSFPAYVEMLVTNIPPQRLDGVGYSSKLDSVDSVNVVSLCQSVPCHVAAARTADALSLVRRVKVLLRFHSSWGRSTRVTITALSQSPVVLQSWQLLGASSQHRPRQIAPYIVAAAAKQGLLLTDGATDSVGQPIVVCYSFETHQWIPHWTGSASRLALLRMNALQHVMYVIHPSESLLMLIQRWPTLSILQDLASSFDDLGLQGAIAPVRNVVHGATAESVDSHVYDLLCHWGLSHGRLATISVLLLVHWRRQTIVWPVAGDATKSTQFPSLASIVGDTQSSVAKSSDFIAARSHFQQQTFWFLQHLHDKPTSGTAKIQQLLEFYVYCNILKCSQGGFDDEIAIARDAADRNGDNKSQDMTPSRNFTTIRSMLLRRRYPGFDAKVVAMIVRAISLIGQYPGEYIKSILLNTGHSELRDRILGTLHAEPAGANTLFSFRPEVTTVETNGLDSFALSARQTAALDRLHLIERLYAMRCFSACFRRETTRQRAHFESDHGNQPTLPARKLSDLSHFFEPMMVKCTLGSERDSREVKVEETYSDKTNRDEQSTSTSQVKHSVGDVPDIGEMTSDHGWHEYAAGFQRQDTHATSLVHAMQAATGTSERCERVTAVRHTRRDSTVDRTPNETGSMRSDAQYSARHLYFHGVLAWALDWTASNSIFERMVIACTTGSATGQSITGGNKVDFSEKEARTPSTSLFQTYCVNQTPVFLAQIEVRYLVSHHQWALLQHRLQRWFTLLRKHSPSWQVILLEFLNAVQRHVCTHHGFVQLAVCLANIGMYVLRSNHGRELRYAVLVTAAGGHFYKLHEDAEAPTLSKPDFLALLRQVCQHGHLFDHDQAPVSPAESPSTTANSLAVSTRCFQSDFVLQLNGLLIRQNLKLCLAHSIVRFGFANDVGDIDRILTCLRGHLPNSVDHLPVWAEVMLRGYRGGAESVFEACVASACLPGHSRHSQNDRSGLFDNEDPSKIRNVVLSSSAVVSIGTLLHASRAMLTELCRQRRTAADDSFANAIRRKWRELLCPDKPLGTQQRCKFVFDLLTQSIDDVSNDDTPPHQPSFYEVDGDSTGLHDFTTAHSDMSVLQLQQKYSKVDLSSVAHYSKYMKMAANGLHIFAVESALVKEVSCGYTFFLSKAMPMEAFQIAQRQYQCSNNSNNDSTSAEGPTHDKSSSAGRRATMALSADDRAHLRQEVRQVAFLHGLSESVVSACIVFLWMFDLDTEHLRVDIAALRRIYTFEKGTKPQRLHGPQHQNSKLRRLAKQFLKLSDISTDADTALHQDPVDKASGAVKLLQRLGEATRAVNNVRAFGSEKYGEADKQQDSDGSVHQTQLSPTLLDYPESKWKLVTLFCRVHGLPRSLALLHELARRSNWVLFLHEAQRERCGLDVVIDIVQTQFRETALKAHIICALQPLRDTVGKLLSGRSSQAKHRFVRRMVRRTFQSLSCIDKVAVGVAEAHCLQAAEEVDKLNELQFINQRYSMHENWVYGRRLLSHSLDMLDMLGPSQREIGVDSADPRYSDLLLFAQKCLLQYQCYLQFLSSACHKKCGLQIILASSLARFPEAPRSVVEELGRSPRSKIPAHEPALHPSFFFELDAWIAWLLVVLSDEADRGSYVREESFDNKLWHTYCETVSRIAMHDLNTQCRILLGHPCSTTHARNSLADSFVNIVVLGHCDGIDAADSSRDESTERGWIEKKFEFFFELLSQVTQHSLAAAHLSAHLFGSQHSNIYRFLSGLSECSKFDWSNDADIAAFRKLVHRQATSGHPHSMQAMWRICEDKFCERQLDDLLFSSTNKADPLKLWNVLRVLDSVSFGVKYQRAFRLLSAYIDMFSHGVGAELQQHAGIQGHDQSTSADESPSPPTPFSLRLLSPDTLISQLLERHNFSGARRLAQDTVVDVRDAWVDQISFMEAFAEVHSHLTVAHARHTAESAGSLTWFGTVLEVFQQHKCSPFVQITFFGLIVMGSSSNDVNPSPKTNTAATSDRQRNVAAVSSSFNHVFPSVPISLLTLVKEVVQHPCMALNWADSLLLLNQIASLQAELAAAIPRFEHAEIANDIVEWICSVHFKGHVAALATMCKVAMNCADEWHAAWELSSSSPRTYHSVAGGAARAKFLDTCRQRGNVWHARDRTGFALMDKLMLKLPLIRLLPENVDFPHHIDGPSEEAITFSIDKALLDLDARSSLVIANAFSVYTPSLRLVLFSLMLHQRRIPRAPQSAPRDLHHSLQHAIQACSVVQSALATTLNYDDDKITECFTELLGCKDNNWNSIRRRSILRQLLHESESPSPTIFVAASGLVSMHILSLQKVGTFKDCNADEMWLQPSVAFSNTLLQHVLQDALLRHVTFDTSSDEVKLLPEAWSSLFLLRNFVSLQSLAYRDSSADSILGVFAQTLRSHCTQWISTHGASDGAIHNPIAALWPRKLLTMLSSLVPGSTPRLARGMLRLPTEYRKRTNNIDVELLCAVDALVGAWVCLNIGSDKSPATSVVAPPTQPHADTRRFVRHQVLTRISNWWATLPPTVAAIHTARLMRSVPPWVNPILDWCITCSVPDALRMVIRELSRTTHSHMERSAIASHLMQQPRSVIPFPDVVGHLRTLKFSRELGDVLAAEATREQGAVRRALQRYNSSVADGALKHGVDVHRSDALSCLRGLYLSLLGIFQLLLEAAKNFERSHTIEVDPHDCSLEIRRCSRLCQLMKLQMVAVDRVRSHVLGHRELGTSRARVDVIIGLSREEALARFQTWLPESCDRGCAVLASFATSNVFAANYGLSEWEVWVRPTYYHALCGGDWGFFEKCVDGLASSGNSVCRAHTSQVARNAFVKSLLDFAWEAQGTCAPDDTDAEASGAESTTNIIRWATAALHGDFAHTSRELVRDSIKSLASSAAKSAMSSFQSMLAALALASDDTA